MSSAAAAVAGQSWDAAALRCAVRARAPYIIENVKTLSMNQVGRYVSKPVLKAPMISALEAKM